MTDENKEPEPLPLATIDEMIEHTKGKVIEAALQAARLRHFGSYIDNGNITRPGGNDIEDLIKYFDGIVQHKARALLEYLSQKE